MKMEIVRVFMIISLFFFLQFNVTSYRILFYLGILSSFRFFFSCFLSICSVFSVQIIRRKTTSREKNVLRWNEHASIYSICVNLFSTKRIVRVKTKNIFVYWGKRKKITAKKGIRRSDYTLYLYPRQIYK